MNRNALYRLAADGGELPDGLDMEETFLFLSLRNLAKYAKDTNMSKEEASKERRKIELSSKRFSENKQLLQYIAHVNLVTGSARAAYRKAKTDRDKLDAARAIIKALENMEVD